MSHYVDARSVGQPDIADEKLAGIGRRLAECGLDPADDAYAMPSCRQRFVKSVRRILVIFDEKNIEATMRCHGAIL